MFRIKISWLLAFVTVLIWSVVIFQFSAFAADDVIWTENVKPFNWSPSWGTLSGCPEVIEMKPTMLAPKGTPASPMRSLLSRVLGKSLGGLVARAGIVFSVLDLENRRQTVAYAIEQLKQNGQPVTFDTIQDWIAEDHDINTDGVTTDYDASDGFITSTDSNLPVPLTYEVGALESSNFYLLYGDSYARSWCSEHGYTLHPGFGAIYNRMGPATIQTPVKLYVWQDYIWSSTYSVNYNRYKVYPLISYTVAPGAFDPANYPQLFGPDFFPSEAIDALIARDLNSFDIEMSKSSSDFDDHIFVDVDSGQPSVDDPELWELLAKGFKYVAPAAALGDAVLTKFNDESGTVKIQTDKGDTTLSKTDSQEFIDSGVPEGATIIRVDPETGTITYKDPTTGETKTAQVSKDKAASVTNDYSVYNTVNNSTKTTNIHQEINLPEVHVSGSIDVSNGTLQPVSTDRVEAARTRFQESWNNLKQTFADMFTVNLTGVGRLPTWNWPMLGHVIVVDFNNYADELNWLGIAFLFFATISAVFIVINH